MGMIFSPNSVAICNELNKIDVDPSHYEELRERVFELECEHQLWQTRRHVMDPAGHDPVLRECINRLTIAELFLLFEVLTSREDDSHAPILDGRLHKPEIQHSIYLGQEWEQKILEVARFMEFSTRID